MILFSINETQYSVIRKPRPSFYTRYIPNLQNTATNIMNTSIIIVPHLPRLFVGTRFLDIRKKVSNNKLKKLFRYVKEVSGVVS